MTRLRLARLVGLLAPIACMMHCSGRAPAERSEAPSTVASQARAGRLDATIGRPDEPVVLRSASGLGVSLELLGARGSAWERASPLGGGVRFARRDGVFEDYVEVATPPARARLSYALGLVGVAAIRELEGVVELLDAGGAPRLRMAPPRLVTRDGAERAVAATIEGCTVDRDPAPPWGRPHAAPGAQTCSLHLSWEARADDYPLWVDPAWIAGPNMVALRSFHHAARLDDGRVLVVGGERSPDPSAELYDPATDTWATVAGASRHGVFLSLTKLADGRIVAAGGTDLTTDVRSRAIDLFDPKTGVFTAQAPFAVGRAGHSATLLRDGRVLFVGGFVTLDVTKEVLTYEPEGGLRAGPPLPAPRGHHGAVRLPDDRVLVAGGETCCDTLPFAPLASSVIFDPGAGSWSTGPSLLEPRYDCSADLLPDGTVIVAGGSTQFYEKGQLATVESLAPGQSSWSALGSFAVPRSSHRTALMPSGRLLVAGTFGPDFTATSVRLTERIDGTRRSVSPLPSLAEARSGATVTTLADGRALVTGGGAIDRGSRTTEVLGTPLGAACGPEDCANGYCVEGVCCPSEASCKGSDAGAPDASVSASDAGADASPAASEGDRTSYHACALGPVPASSKDRLALGATIALALAWWRRRRRPRV